MTENAADNRWWCESLQDLVSVSWYLPPTLNSLLPQQAWSSHLYPFYRLCTFYERHPRLMNSVLTSWFLILWLDHDARNSNGKKKVFHQNNNRLNNSRRTFRVQRVSAWSLINRLIHGVSATSINGSNSCHEIRTKTREGELINLRGRCTFQTTEYLSCAWKTAYAIITWKWCTLCLPYSGMGQRESHKFRSIIRLQSVSTGYSLSCNWLFLGSKTILCNLDEKSLACFAITYNIKVQLKLK